VTEDMNGAKEPVETCYKCKAPGHVRSSHLCSPRSCVLTVRLVYRSLGIAPKDASRSWRKTIRGASLSPIPGVVMEHLWRPMGTRASRACIDYCNRIVTTSDNPCSIIQSPIYVLYCIRKHLTICLFALDMDYITIWSLIHVMGKSQDFVPSG
jgi:hypothetical protein